MHVLGMQLVLDVSALDKRGRRKVFVVQKRIEHITRDIQGRFTATGVIDTFKLEERASLRWILWRLGVVVADTADPKWTSEHPRQAAREEDLAIARRIAAETPVDTRDEPELIERIVRALAQARLPEAAE